MSVEKIDKGVLLLATGFPIYGTFCYNLAVTIRAIEPGTHISIACDERAISYLDAKQRSIFDNIIPVSTSGFGGKLHLDLITPYERTLFLDADMAWMPKHGPSVLFDKLADVEFTSITEGHDEEPSGAYFFWADVEEIRKVYRVTNRIYQWRSEVMYFTNTERVSSMFSKAREIHSNPRLRSVKMFGTQVPDELALNVSLAMHDMHPHAFKWTPAYWPKLHGENVPPFEELYDQYYLLSAGSHYASGSLERVYNRLVKAAAYKTGNVRTFPLKNKAESIPDRAKF